MIPIESRRLVYCLLIVIVFPLFQMSAQYYEQKEYAPAEARYIATGFLDREFTPRSTNSQSDSLKIRYKRLMPVISFRQGAAEVMLGYAAYKLSGESRSAVFLGARFSTEIPVAGRRGSALLFPLGLAADYTKASGIGPSKEDFNIASVGIGAGLKYRYVSGGVDFSIGVEELAQYASEGIGIGSGFSSSTLGDAVVLLRDLAVFEGMVIGYRFRLQTWSMSESKFNYRSVSHGPYIGIIF